jgi:formylglycine-generating enzyme required for sulfatase activity
MAVAGIIVGSVAGIGSINNAINNNVPVIQAMNKALDMANQKGDAQLIQNIKQDIEVARLSLDSGKDLNTVKNMQDRYAKFMPTDYKTSTPAVKFKEAEEVSKTDTLTIDIPMFIRLMEYAREDAKTDMDLHNVATNLLKIKDKTISMADYDQVVQSTGVDTADESFKDKVMKKIAQPIKDYNKDKEQAPKKS